jgi:hypothetical protein
MNKTINFDFGGVFIDVTTTHTKSVSNLGIHIWNIVSDNDDITSLFEIKKSLFN